jgi:hypothetical protein
VRARQVGVVQDGDDGEAAVVCQVGEELHHLRGRGGVERRRRLVGEDHARALAQGAGHGDALLLPAGEPARAVEGAVRQPDGLQAEHGLGAQVAAEQGGGERAAQRQPSERPRAHVVQRGAPGHERDLLEDHRDAAT